MANEETTVAEQPEGKKYLGTTVSAALHKRCRTHAAKTDRQMNELLEEAVNMLIDYEEGGMRHVPGTTLSVSNRLRSNETEQDK